MPWGGKPYEDLYGEEGWCNASMPRPNKWAGCHLDGFSGPNCEKRHEMVSANQCSGHGTCFLGFCKVGRG